MSSVLITGATRGIGRAVAEQAGAAGDHVIVTGREQTQVDSTVAGLAADGYTVEGVVLDVTDPVSVKAAAVELGSRFDSLDTLINNAGILPEASASQPMAVLNSEMMRRSIETNLLGPVAVIDAFLPLLKRSPRGRIVNVSTRMASFHDQLDQDSPYYGMIVPAYQASKAALNSLTIGLSKALSDSTVTVAAVCPGFVQTDLTPMNRNSAPLTAEQAAATVYAVARNDDRSTGTFTDADGVVPW